MQVGKLRLEDRRDGRLPEQRAACSRVSGWWTPYGLVRADLAAVAAAVVRRYAGSNMRLD